MSRDLHGALLDAELLAEVYLELIGARQAMLGLAAVSARTDLRGTAAAVRVRPAPLPPLLTDEEVAAHRAFVATLGDNAIWRLYSAA